MDPTSRFYEILKDRSHFREHINELIELANSGEVHLNRPVVLPSGKIDGTPLSYVCRYYPTETDLINAMISGGADPNRIVSRNINTPLVSLIKSLTLYPENNDIVDCIENLITVGEADPNLVLGGVTALSSAIWACNYHVILLLISQGANLRQPSMTPSGSGYQLPIDDAFYVLFYLMTSDRNTAIQKNIIKLLVDRGSPMLNEEVYVDFLRKARFYPVQAGQIIRFANLLADEREKKEAIEYDVFYRSLAHLPDKTMKGLPDEALNNIQSFLVPTPRTIPHAVMRSALAAQPAASQIEFDEKEESEPELIFEYKEDHNDLD